MVTVNGKEYPVAWDNKALHDFGKMCGANTMTEVQQIMFDLSQVFQKPDAAQSLDVFDKLVKLALVSIRTGCEVNGVAFDLSERTLYNHSLENPDVLTSVFEVMIEASPKPRKEDEVVEKKNTKDET